MMDTLHRSLKREKKKNFPVLFLSLSRSIIKQQNFALISQLIVSRLRVLFDLQYQAKIMPSIKLLAYAAFWTAFIIAMVQSDMTRSLSTPLGLLTEYCSSL